MRVALSLNPPSTSAFQIVSAISQLVSVASNFATACCHLQLRGVRIECVCRLPAECFGRGPHAKSLLSNSSCLCSGPTISQGSIRILLGCPKDRIEHLAVDTRGITGNVTVPEPPPALNRWFPLRIGELRAVIVISATGILITSVIAATIAIVFSAVSDFVVGVVLAGAAFVVCVVTTVDVFLSWALLLLSLPVVRAPRSILPFLPQQTLYLCHPCPLAPNPSRDKYQPPCRCFHRYVHVWGSGSHRAIRRCYRSSISLTFLQGLNLSSCCTSSMLASFLPRLLRSCRTLVTPVAAEEVSIMRFLPSLFPGSLPDLLLTLGTRPDLLFISIQSSKFRGYATLFATPRACTCAFSDQHSMEDT